MLTAVCRVFIEGTLMHLTDLVKGGDSRSKFSLGQLFSCGSSQMKKSRNTSVFQRERLNTLWSTTWSPQLDEVVWWDVVWLGGGCYLNVTLTVCGGLMSELEQREIFREVCTANLHLHPLKHFRGIGRTPVLWMNVNLSEEIKPTSPPDEVFKSPNFLLS